MATLNDRTKENYPLVSLGHAYDKFSTASPEDIEQTKDRIVKLNLDAITLVNLGGPWPYADKGPSAAADRNLQDQSSSLTTALLPEKTATRSSHDWNLEPLHHSDVRNAPWPKDQSSHYRPCIPWHRHELEIRRRRVDSLSALATARSRKHLYRDTEPRFRSTTKLNVCRGCLSSLLLVKEAAPFGVTTLA